MQVNTSQKSVSVLQVTTQHVCKGHKHVNKILYQIHIISVLVGQHRTTKIAFNTLEEN